MTLEDGSKATDDKQIGEAMVDYFKNLFTSVVPSNFESILHGVECKVTPAMNADLTKDFTTKEVEQSIKQMKAMTSPGPDGMPPLFYKSLWNTVGQDVTAACLSVLNTGSLPPNINHTFLTLIPKNKSPERPTDF